MADSSDFIDILIEQGKLDLRQREEAIKLAQRREINLVDALIQLRFVSDLEIMDAIAQRHGMACVDLDKIEIPASVIELVPESVARENSILPFERENGALKLVTCYAPDPALVDQLRFILEPEIKLVLARKDSLLQEIDRHYGRH